VKSSTLLLYLKEIKLVRVLKRNNSIISVNLRWDAGSSNRGFPRSLHSRSGDCLIDHYRFRDNHGRDLPSRLADPPVANWVVGQFEFCGVARWRAICL
jgi:hypothetical protein